MALDSTRLEIQSALGCNIYISEGRNKQLLEQLQAEAEATPGVVLANLFADQPYNRSGFTFVSTQPDRLTAAVVRLSRAALRLLDLRAHDARHPRLGVVDHVSLHPLGGLVRPHTHTHHHAHAHAHTHTHAHAHAHPQEPQHHQRQQHHQHHHPSSHAHGRPASPRPGEDGAAAAAPLSSPAPHSQARAEPPVSAPHTVWEPPPTGLAGMAVAASCAQDIAWSLAGPADPDPGEADEPEWTASSLAPGGGGAGGAASGATHGTAGERQGLAAAPPVPVYLYGFAHGSRRTLAEIRRQLGYFRGSPDGDWAGGLERLTHAADLSAFPPDLGPLGAPPRAGVVTVGAVPWVVNFNVPLHGVDLDTARQLARGLTERGGGLPAVEAMALQHNAATVEIACNLLDESVSSEHAVRARLEVLAAARGLTHGSLGAGYRTNKTPEQLLRAAAGAILEAALRRAA